MKTASQPWLARLFTMVFLGYLCVLLGFHRDLARLSVTMGSIPVFTGEAALIGLLSIQIVLAWRRRRAPFRFNLVDALVLVYFVVGLGYAVVGLARGFGLATLRDFALVYYSAFYFLARAALAWKSQEDWLIAVLAVGGVVSATVASVGFLIAPTMGDGHGAPGWVALSSWIAVLALLRSRFPAGAIAKLGWLLGLGACGFAVYLSAYRTIAAVIFVGLGAVFAAWRWSGLRDFRDLLMRAGIWTMILVAVAGVHFWLARPPSGPARMYGPVALSEGLRMISGRWALQSLEVKEYLPPDAKGREGTSVPGKPTRVVPGGLVTSYSFRTMAWKNAWQRIRNAPVLGIGFGPSAVLHSEKLCLLVASPISNCGAAHNTYLTLAMRMGIPVLVLLLVANLVAAMRLVRLLRDQRAGAQEARNAVVLGLALLSSLIYAVTSLFLESPYLSAPYWTILGGLVALTDPWRAPADVRRAPSAVAVER